MSNLMIEIKQYEYLIKLKRGEIELLQLKNMIRQLAGFNDLDEDTHVNGFKEFRSAELAERFDHLSDK